MSRLQFSMLLLAVVLCITGLGLLAEQVNSVYSSQSQRQSDTAVITAASKLVHLNQEQLVDQLESVSQDLALRRATWLDDERLIIDLKIPASAQSTSLIYQEIFRWLQFCFNETDNVARLQLRIIVEDVWMKKKYVLLAMDANRDVVDTDVLTELKTGLDDLSQRTETLLRMTYTPLWVQIFDRDV